MLARGPSIVLFSECILFLPVFFTRRAVSNPVADSVIAYSASHFLLPLHWAIRSDGVELEMVSTAYADPSSRASRVLT